ncbi:radical SAM protein [Flavobacterium sp. CYK-4]|uniref:radical SAM protein n=1 Tax=Flavobacterium lotistagni TaxID=2709660 RepID=UPI001407A08A|nr:radical SAM protein [Flavobacterium lotistagni]NHM05884.1 radical SAM protein [Flavobacterium lotistagni]
MVERILKYTNKKVLPQHYFFSPEWIVLGVNNTCNLHCKMCDVGTQSLDTNFATNLVGTTPLNMPMELFEKIADQTAQYFPKAKIGFAFTEPLAYPGIIKAVEYATQKKLYTAITTNALLLPNKAEALVRAGLSEIYVSLDGLETTHNMIRGNEKSFQKALEGVRKLFSLPNPPKVSIVSVITEWNVANLKEFANYFKDLPLHEIVFMHTIFGEPAIAITHNKIWGKTYPATESNLDEVTLNNMDLPLLLEQIQKIRSENYPFKIYFSPEIHDLKNLETYYHQSGIILGKRCEAVYSSIMIKSDGSTIPAHGRCYNLQVGNIYETSLKEIWNSNVFGKFRKDLRDAGGFLPACSRCCSAF